MSFRTILAGLILWGGNCLNAPGHCLGALSNVQVEVDSFYRGKAALPRSIKSLLGKLFSFLRKTKPL